MASDSEQPSGQANLASRVEELEVRSVYQDKNVEELDAVVREFADRVQRLEKEIYELRARLESLGVPASDGL